MAEELSPTESVAKALDQVFKQAQVIGALPKMLDARLRKNLAEAIAPMVRELMGVAFEEGVDRMRALALNDQQVLMHPEDRPANPFHQES